MQGPPLYSNPSLRIGTSALLPARPSAGGSQWGKPSVGVRPTSTRLCNGVRTPADERTSAGEMNRTKGLCPAEPSTAQRGNNPFPLLFRELGLPWAGPQSSSLPEITEQGRAFRRMRHFAGPPLTILGFSVSTDRNHTRLAGTSHEFSASLGEWRSPDQHGAHIKEPETHACGERCSVSKPRCGPAAGRCRVLLQQHSPQAPATRLGPPDESTRTANYCQATWGVFASAAKITRKLHDIGI